MRESARLRDLERRTTEEGQALARSVGAARRALEPRHLAEAVARRLKTSLFGAASAATNGGRNTAGLVATVASIGVVVTTLVRGRGRASHTEGIDAETTPPHAPKPLRALAGVAVAFGLGFAVSRVAAGPPDESDPLKGLGAEVKAAMDRWARDEIGRLAHPGQHDSFGLLNAIAVGLDLFSTPRPPTA